MPIQSPFISYLGDCKPADNCDPGSCQNAAPRSNFDLQVLEGMELAKIAPAATEEYRTANNLIRAKEKLAIALTIREIKARLRKTFQFKDVIESQVAGSFVRYQFNVVTGLYGVEVRNTSCDPFTKIKLDWIEIKANAPFQKELTIVYGCTTEVRCVELACGVNRIELNLEDKERIAVFATFCGEEIAPLSVCGLADDLSCIKDECGCDCLLIRGVTDTDPVGDPVIDPLEEFESAKNYFRVCAGCLGDVDEIFCKFWEEVELPILYRLGILLMLEIAHSTSTYPIVRNSKESAERLLSQWYGGTDAVSMIERKGDYWNLVDQAVTFFESTLKVMNTKIIKCTGDRIIYTLPA